MNQTGIMLKRLNDALPGLILGILVYGVLVEVIGVWFVADKIRYTTGLAIGIALACGMAVNMAVVLQDAEVDTAIYARSDRIFCYDEVESGESDHRIYWCFGLESISVLPTLCT